MNRKLSIFTVTVYLLLGGIIYGTTSLLKDKPVKATVYPLRVFAGEAIHYRDSTENAQNIQWEFGNGANSHLPNGVYEYKEPGTYLVKLRINNKEKLSFPIEVVQPEVVYYKDSSVFIYSSPSGIVNQRIHFKAMGTGIEWYEWYFGETGKIDARTSESFYSFKKPGIYTVKLITNLNYNKPQKHKIQILDAYDPGYRNPENPVIPVIKENAKGSGSGNDLIKKIKAIAQGEDFASNYNFVLKKYLCSNPNTPVVINQKHTTDFYSYCQNLQIKSGQKVLKVAIEQKPGSNCVSILKIQQQ